MIQEKADMAKLIIAARGLLQDAIIDMVDWRGFIEPFRDWSDRVDGIVKAKDPHESLLLWHLPSVQTLTAMNVYQPKIPGLTAKEYWSSSVLRDPTGDVAWYHHFWCRMIGTAYKENELAVRAVRALPANTDETERIFRCRNVIFQAYQEDAPELMPWYMAIKWCENLNKENDT